MTVPHLRLIRDDPEPEDGVLLEQLARSIAIVRATGKMPRSSDRYLDSGATPKGEQAR